MKTLLSLFIITILMVYSGESHAQLETTERTHFIVLIRDTGLMTQKFFPQKMIIPTLPKLLYQGVNTPIYQPKRDHLSVVFVGIHRDQNTSICKEEAALSALPQHLFQWQMVEQGQNQNTFTQSLRQWLNQECRGEGRVSSTVLAQTMILPYVHQKMADTGYGTLRFSRTILVMLDNEAYYGDTFPSTELSELERQEKVRDIEQAASFVNAVSSAFHIITPRDWIFTVNPYKHNKLEQGNTLLDGTNTLRYRLVEVQPLDTNVDNYIDYTKKVKLERVAISNEKMQLVQQEGKKIGLRLLHSDRLRPEQIELKFWDQTHGSWKIGQHHLPSTSVINIKDCIDSNKCELLEDAMIYVPLMGAEELYLMSDDPALTAGQIRFKVRFRYNAVYDHHYIDTNWKTIDIKPVKPFIIPNSPFLGWLFPKIILDNKTLTNKYSFAQDAQNGLTHKIAYARIVATRKMLQMVCLAFLVSSLVIILFILLYKYLHKKAYHRLFNPLLDWNLAKKIDIDFNQSPGARVLVGTLNFKNEGHVPWFGRLHGNRDYPDYIIDIHLDYNNKKLIEHGFSLANNMGEPFGFREVGEGSLLKRKIPYRVNHETPIYVFLATDVINDFKAHLPVSGTHTVTFGGIEKNIEFSVELSRSDKYLISRTIEFDLELIPEQAKPPLVTYQSAKEALYFNKAKRVDIGVFKFESQAKHHFACSFLDKFNLRCYQDNLPLTHDKAVALYDENVVVSPYKTSQNALAVLCDGDVISNPAPPSQDYSFNLLGEFAPGSKPNNNWFSLLRDPTRADLHLDIIQCKKTHRIHWEQKEHPTCRMVENRIVKKSGEVLDQDVLELPPYFVEFGADMPESTVFKIHIGNTGHAGLGWIKANLKIALKFKPWVRGSIQTKSGYDIEDSLLPVDENIIVNEGDSPEIILVQIDATTTIQDIIGGRIDPDGGCIEATLNIEIQDDKGFREKQPTRQRHLLIRAPIGLEKLPHPNWLCIDFGTSAIVAAIGLGDQPYILPLQKIISKKDDALNFGDYDPSNTESGSDFLPSSVICNADLRQNAIQNQMIRKGFPKYQPASLQPGEPDFIGFPAKSRDIRESPERMIHSLKSWLAQPSDSILLQETIKFEKEDGEVVVRNRLPLEKMVESGFAALAEAYITAFEIFEKGGQVILSHPNTFTDFHKKKLHDIAWRAFNQRLGIALPERIHLISESDAVAYHYCRQRMLNNQQRMGWERLLIYDFGAGTLDLSLVHVQWNRDGVYPEKWKVENRLGVPIAGNHLDRLLARLVDQCLKNKSILNPKIFEYKYPIVEQTRGNESEKVNRRLATHRLWHSIRQTKHAWDGKKPFRVKIGALGTTDVVVYKDNGGKIETGDNDKLSIEQNEDKEFYLCIPSKVVHDYPLLKEFIDFVTDVMVDELLLGADLAVKDVNTVVVSGRGALWGGLRERVWDKFSNCEKPDLTDGNQVKSAVVSGAIAWQNLSQVQESDNEIKPHLAILRDDDQILVSEKEWETDEIKENGIDLRSTSSFSLVQISHKNPEPRKDLNSLRCHFYIPLKRYYSRTKWKKDPRLFVRREGKTIIRVENAQGDGFDFKALGLNSHLMSIPPWPIGGDGVLPPKEVYY